MPLEHIKNYFKWGEKGTKFAYTPGDFIGKAMARGLACSEAPSYKRKIKSSKKLK